jgi:CRP-like cAMP-binding protein
VVIKKGDPGDKMYLIVQGSCQVSEFDDKGAVVPINKGAYFGEVALLRDVPRTATITAMEHCVAMTIDKNALHTKLAKLKTMLVHNAIDLKVSLCFRSSLFL